MNKKIVYFLMQCTFVLLFESSFNILYSASATGPDAHAINDRTRCSAQANEFVDYYKNIFTKFYPDISCRGHSVFIASKAIENAVEIPIHYSSFAVSGAPLFYGFASFYNQIKAFVINEAKEIQRTNRNEKIALGTNKLYVGGRFNAMYLSADGANILLNESNLKLSWPKGSRVQMHIVLSTQVELVKIYPELESVRYAHLWSGLAALAKCIEWTLSRIYRYMGENWGWAIIILAIAVKLILLPIGMLTVRFQRQVSGYQRTLAPILSEIKEKFDGEEAHTRIMAAHKDIGITPFYTLKPLLGTCIQLPFLIAIFNALGEMPQLNGVSFLWIDNLAYPDIVQKLPFVVPYLGDKLSLLPIAMTLITLVSTALFANRVAPKNETKRQKRNLYIMAALFFVLFYPFPAAMVLYWTCANVLQTAQQQVVKI